MDPDNKEDFERLDSALKNIDPSLRLVSQDNNSSNAIDTLKQFYFEHYGVPGTSEFEAKIEEINNNVN